MGIREGIGSAPRRRRIGAALEEVLAGRQDGPWSVDVRPTLVYESPSLGTWWWRVTLTPASGDGHVLLVEPERQAPRPLQEMVERALRGEWLTVACASCGRVRMGATWERRDRLRQQARVSHGICPDCAERLYPRQARRIGASTARPRARRSTRP